MHSVDEDGSSCRVRHGVCQQGAQALAAGPLRLRGGEGVRRARSARLASRALRGRPPCPGLQSPPCGVSGHVSRHSRPCGLSSCLVLPPRVSASCAHLSVLVRPSWPTRTRLPGGLPGPAPSSLRLPAAPCGFGTLSCVCVILEGFTCPLGGEHGLLRVDFLASRATLGKLLALSVPHTAPAECGYGRV